MRAGFCGDCRQRRLDLGDKLIDKRERGGGTEQSRQ
jgi:hypothetical protein